MRVLACSLLCLLLALPAMAQPRPAPPAEATTEPTELNALLDALKLAPSEPAAGVLAGRIGQIWLSEGGPAAGLLLARGARNLRDNAADEALKDFDAALVLAPELAEAFNRRAMAHFELGDYPAALADLEQALRRDHRHFSAFATLSRIAEAREDWKGALAAWQKLLEFNPRQPGGAERLEMLTKKAFGEQL